MRWPNAWPRGSPQPFPPRRRPRRPRRASPALGTDGAGRAVTLKVELKILDPRLLDWGFPHYGSSLAAGLDLHACIDAPLMLRPQAPGELISARFAVCLRDPPVCGP